MIYLDYSANTPTDNEVLENFSKITQKYIGNPNSTHKLGLEAKKVIDLSTLNIAGLLDVNKEGIIYTSGASESNNLVLKGYALNNKDKGRHIIISPLEHSSIIAPCNYLASLGFEITVLNLNESGTIDIEELKNSIRDDTILVSICYVDSELGTIQPINEISNIISKYPNCKFHTDATQAVGKINIDFTKCDFVTFTPHKFYGLNGFGVLINNNEEKIIPLIHGGKSTTIYRSGTPVTANVSSLYIALKKAIENLPDRYEYITNLKQKLIDELSIFSQVHINTPKNSIPNTINFSLKNIDSKKVVEKLSNLGVCVSTGSACSLGNTPSKAVYAITNDLELAKNSIRVSISHLTTEEEINEFIKLFKQIYEEELTNENN